MLNKITVLSSCTFSLSFKKDSTFEVMENCSTSFSKAFYSIIHRTLSGWQDQRCEKRRGLWCIYRSPLFYKPCCTMCQLPYRMETHTLLHFIEKQLIPKCVSIKKITKSRWSDEFLIKKYSNFTIIMNSKFHFNCSACMISICFLLRFIFINFLSSDFYNFFTSEF